jgi:hypothetical protein
MKPFDIVQVKNTKSVYCIMNYTVCSVVDWCDAVQHPFDANLRNISVIFAAVVSIVFGG